MSRTSAVARTGKKMVSTRFLAPFAVLLLSACATTGGGGASASGEVETLARLLMAEDRLEYDEALLRATVAPGVDPELRRRAAMAAGRIGDKRATPLLTGLLADADTGVVASAAFALGDLGDTTAVPALVPLVSVDRVATAPTVVGEAALALGKMPTAAGRAAVEDFLRAAPRSGQGVQRAVGQALLAVWRFPRPGDVAPIAPWLDNPDPELRWRAVYALARRPSAAGTRLVFPRIDDQESLARSFAVRALARALADSSNLGARAERAALAATRDSLHTVSVNAVRTLGGYDSPESIARLVQLLRGGDPYLSITAAESLLRLGARAASATGDLRAVAMDPARPVFVRTTALSALVVVAPAEARGVADAFAATDGWRYRTEAARAYANAGAGERALPFAQDRDGRVAFAAIEALHAAADDSVARLRPLFLQALQHPDVMARTQALNGLLTLADPSTRDAVLAAYERAQRDTLNDAALAALDALGAIAKKDASTAEAFFSRFSRSGDYLVRQRAATAFGDSVATARWGAPLPVEPGRGIDWYRRIARSYLLPRVRGGDRPRARIVTDRGVIEVEMFVEDAPLTTWNFLELARRGFFNGQEWPRVVPNFVIQGGDPRGDTSGGPGYAIRDEINRRPYQYGTLGMALSGPDTGGSQWFITHSPQPHLDGGYTVFGRLVSGMDVVERILPGDRILRVEEVR